MNEKQHQLLPWAAAVLVGMVLFPPFTYYQSDGMKRNVGYSFLLEPPKGANNNLAPLVNVQMLVTQEFVAVLAFGTMYFYFGRQSGS